MDFAHTEILKLQDDRIVKIGQHFCENHGVPGALPMGLHEIKIKAGCYKLMEKMLFLRFWATGEPSLWEERAEMQNVTKIQNDWNIFVTEM
jgi:hypothetical protein